MNKSSVSRRYESPLRDEQHQRTRDQILDGLLEAMKGGLANLSVPAVAKAARVSVPTVYRHFPTKAQLFDAVAQHVGTKTGLSQIPLPKNPDELCSWVRETFRGIRQMDPALAAAMGAGAGKE